MRWCVIGPTYPFRGGIAHYTTLLTRALRREHEVLLVSFKRQYPRWLFPGRSDRDPSERPLREEAVYWLDSLNPLTWWQTARRINQWQPDVVVMQWWTLFWAPVWMLLARLLKRGKEHPRLIYIVHNARLHEPTRYDQFVTRLTLASAEALIAHAQADAEALRAWFPRAEIAVSPLPTYASLADSAEATTGLETGVESDRPNILFCGIVRRYKGLDILLEAMPLVLAQIPEAHLTVVGEFWDEVRPYEQQIDRLRLQRHVTIRNEYVTDETLVAYLRQVDVVVLPYRSATQSAIVQAAFGQGTPVITTAVGGLPESVLHDKTGLVVPPNNPEAIAGAIVRYFLENLAAPFTMNIDQQQTRFSWQLLVRSLVTAAKPQ